MIPVSFAFVLVSAIIAFGQIVPLKSQEAVSSGHDDTKRDRLAREFSRETDKDKKGGLAVQLIMLGDQNPAYFEYLENLARNALETVGPFPFVIEPITIGVSREVVPAYLRKHELSEAYLRWSAANKVDPSISPGERYLAHVKDFMMFSAIKDSRARPLLLKALTSDNAGFVLMAVGGLAMIGNLTDIDTIAQSIRLRDFPERQECYAMLQMHTKSPEATARVEAALSAYDPAGLVFFRELRRELDKLDRQNAKGKEHK